MTTGARVRERASSTLQDWWSDPRRLLDVVLVAAPLVTLAVLGWSRRWISDDSLIAIRTARFLAEGDGPVYNLGERVEAGTSTVWVFLLAGLHLVTRGDWGVEAALAGLVTGMAGFVLACVAAARLGTRLRPGARDRVVLPVGIVVVAVLPAYWDFLTSGLETGGIFGWLGLCYWLLVRRWAASPGDAPTGVPWLTAAVIGLGPLVRPDLGLVTIVFAWCLWRQSDWTRRGLAGAAAAMLALPVLWQVFRMGYYAAVVPNTALAKSAGSSAWGFGFDYLDDFAGRYWLVVPLVVVGTLVGRPLLHLAQASRVPGATALVVGPPVAGLLHAAYVVRIGGDFMHGRMLLPALMCALLPVMAVAVPLVRGAVDSARAFAGLLAVVVWGVVVGVGVRPEPFDPPDNLIADERAFYVLLAQFEPNPVHVDDYRASSWFQAGLAIEELTKTGDDVFVEADFDPVEHEGLPGRGVVARRSTIGQFGFAAEHVFVADSFSLADPVGARLVLPPPEVERPGHNQVVPLSWHLARFTPPSDADSEETRAARAALRCGELADLVAATSEPLTAGRFLDNLVGAVGFSRLSIPGDPIEAEQELC